jgi:hemoglobin
MKHSLYNSFVMLIVVAVMSACATMEPKQEASLYDRLGGKKAVQAVVNDFVNIVRTDERIKNPKVAHLMETIDIDQLKAHLVDQICMGTGGPCKYGGRSMKATHRGLAITGDEFNYVVDDLVNTLNKYSVPEKEKQELLAILGPMRPDIVEVN